MSIGNRIIVLGCPGSGKSTLARRLSEKTGLPLIHLDNLWWRADGTHITREAFDDRLARVLSGDRWIVDGDFHRTCEARFMACDTVIFLDYDEATCLRGIAERVGTARPDIPWVETRLDPELVKLVRGYRDTNRPVIYELMQKYPDRQALIFQNRCEAERWLSGFQACVDICRS